MLILSPRLLSDMQAPEKVEQFAGQRILAMDPRTEKKLRACAACGSSDAQPLGIKNELDIFRAGNVRRFIRLTRPGIRASTTT